MGKRSLIEGAEIFQRLAVALGLGLLIGSVRQKARNDIAGVRTYPLITIFGCICALLTAKLGAWLAAVGLLTLAIMLVIANLHKIKANGNEDDQNPGLTTEISILLMFVLGAYTMLGNLAVAVFVGATATLLVHFKHPLHALIRKVGDKDIHAIMQFVLIALVILPVLPNESFGPYDVFNPFQTWMVVVLIVAISLSAYIVYRVFGAKIGTIIGGILGGLISSTATTFSYAHKARDSKSLARSAATVIAIASTIAFVRIIVEIFVMAPKVAIEIATPLFITLIPMVLGSAVLFFLGTREKDNTELPEQENPAELKSAIIFGALYTAISFAVAVTKDLAGDRGLYVVGAISGLTDVDALTISTAQMAQSGRLDTHIAWQVILLGALANLLFKGVTLSMIGRIPLSKFVLPVFLSAAVAGGFLIGVWPKDASFANMFKQIPAFSEQKVDRNELSQKEDGKKLSQKGNGKRTE